MTTSLLELHPWAACKAPRVRAAVAAAPAAVARAQFRQPNVRGSGQDRARDKAAQNERRKSGAKFARDKNGKLLPRAPRRGLSEVDDPQREAAARLQARHRGKSTRQLLVRGTKHAYSANASRGHLEQDEHEALLGQMKATPAQVCPSRRGSVSNLPDCRAPS